MKVIYNTLFMFPSVCTNNGTSVTVKQDNLHLIFNFYLNFLIVPFTRYRYVLDYFMV